ncbi:MAG: autotransporter outer membrane beta-barrel domain-containing protein [Alphaproteobacteria bacterium]|nr:autotransporter outer membrane beta-barrel domain-containing protein [Alphaproteobacteria bacterium]
MGSVTGPRTVFMVNGDYTGEGGTINFNTWLGDSNSPTDLMVVKGSVFGTTFVTVANADASGLGGKTTGNGIELVAISGGRSAGDAFQQKAPITAGIYEYTLGQNVNGNWYLTSDLHNNNPPPADGGGGDGGGGGGSGGGGGGGSGGNGGGGHGGGGNGGHGGNNEPLQRYRPAVPVYTTIPALTNRFGLVMLDNFDARPGFGDGFGSGDLYDDSWSGRDYQNGNGNGNGNSAGAAPAGYCYGHDGKIYRKAPELCFKARARQIYEVENAMRPRLWARVVGETGAIGSRSGDEATRSAAFLSHGPSYDYDLAAVQAGIDLAHSKSDIVGVYVGGGHVNSTVQQVYGGKAGTMSFDGYSLGGYWTHRAASGWYTDATLQGTWYENIRSQAQASSLNPAWGTTGMTTNGWGIAAAVQAGYPIALGNGFVFDPQAQVIYQHLSIKGGVDGGMLVATGSAGRVQFGDTDTVYGRIGGRLTRGFLTEGGVPIKVWGVANLWHQFTGDAQTSFVTSAATSTLNTSLGGTWTQLGLGISGQVTRNVAVFGTAEYNIIVANGEGYMWGGRAGVKVDW